MKGVFAMRGAVMASVWGAALFVLLGVTDGARADGATALAACETARNQRDADVAYEALVAATEALGGGDDAALMGCATALLDGAIRLRDVRRFHEESAAGSALAEVAHAKLVRVLVHLREYEAVKAEGEKYVARYPNGAHRAAVNEALAVAGAIRRGNAGVVGALLPLSGAYKTFGEGVLESMVLGLSNLAGEATGAGRRVACTRQESDGAGEMRRVVVTCDGAAKNATLKLIAYDTGEEVGRTVTALRKLASEDDVMVVFGPLMSGTAEAAAHEAETLRVPLFALSRHETLAEIGPYVLQHGLTSRDQARAVVNYAMGRLQLKRFAIVYPNHDYGRDLTFAFWDEVEKRGGSVTAVERYAPDATTFKKPASSLVGRYHLELRGEYGRLASDNAGQGASAFEKSKAREKAARDVSPIVDFDAVFIPDFYRTASLIAPALAVEDIVLNTGTPQKGDLNRKVAAGGGVRLLGVAAWNHPDLVKRGGEYVRGSIFVDGFFPAAGGEPGAAFAEAFTKSQRRAPGVVDAHAFDVAALTRAVLTGEVVPRDRAEYLARILSTKGFKAATGELTVAANGEVKRPLYVLTAGRTAISLVDTISVDADAEIPSETTPSAPRPAESGAVTTPASTRP